MGVDLQLEGDTTIWTVYRTGDGAPRSAFLDAVDSVSDPEQWVDGYNSTLETAHLDEVVTADGLHSGVATHRKRMAVAQLTVSWDSESTVMSLNDPEPRTKEETNRASVNVVYHDAGYVFVHGARHPVENGERLVRAVFRSESLSEVAFKTPFLRWVLSKCQAGERLSEAVQFLGPTSVELAGDGPPSSYSLAGGEPVSTAQPLEFLERLADDTVFETLTGRFSLYGEEVGVWFSGYKGVAIFDIAERFEDATPAQCLLFALVFTLELSYVWRDWRRLPDAERGFSDSFQRELQSTIASMQE